MQKISKYKCFSQIFYYNSVNTGDFFIENRACWLRGKLKYLLCQSCYRYIKPIHKEEDLIPLKTAFKIFIIPVINLLNLITQTEGIYINYKLKNKV